MLLLQFEIFSAFTSQGIAYLGREGWAGWRARPDGDRGRAGLGGGPGDVRVPT